MGVLGGILTRGLMAIFMSVGVSVGWSVGVLVDVPNDQFSGVSVACEGISVGGALGVLGTVSVGM